MAPCVALRTPLKTYLFNAPEGTSRYNIIRISFILFNKVNSIAFFCRFLPALRLKPTNINDIFVTRGMRWATFGNGKPKSLYTYLYVISHNVPSLSGVWENIAGISSILLAKVISMISDEYFHLWKKCIFNITGVKFSAHAPARRSERKTFSGVHSPVPGLWFRLRQVSLFREWSNIRTINRDCSKFKSIRL